MQLVVYRSIFVVQSKFPVQFEQCYLNRFAKIAGKIRKNHRYNSTIIL